MAEKNVRISGRRTSRQQYKGTKIKTRVGVAAAALGLAVGVGLGGAISGLKDSFRDKQTIEDAIKLAAKTNTIYELEQGTLDSINDAGLIAQVNYLTSLVNEYTNLKQLSVKGEISVEQEQRLLNIMQQITPELVQNVKQGMLKKKIANACGIEDINNVNINVSRYKNPNGETFNKYQVTANGQELRIDQRIESLIDKAYIDESNIDSSSKKEHAEGIENMIEEYNDFSGILLDKNRVLGYQNGELTLRDKSDVQEINTREDGR